MTTTMQNALISLVNGTPAPKKIRANTRAALVRHGMLDGDGAPTDIGRAYVAQRAYSARVASVALGEAKITQAVETMGQVSDAGAAHARSRGSRTDNPHPQGTARRQWWFTGYDANAPEPTPAPLGAPWNLNALAVAHGTKIRDNVWILPLDAFAPGAFVGGSIEVRGGGPGQGAPSYFCAEQASGVGPRFNEWFTACDQGDAMVAQRVAPQEVEAQLARRANGWDAPGIQNPDLH